MPTFKGLIIIASTSIFLLIQSGANASPNISENSVEKKQKSFIEFMVTHYHVDSKKLIHLLSQSHYDPEVIRRVTYPYEQQPWNIYRKHFLTTKRIDDGVNYWRQHETALRYAENHYGIPPAIIVAIIGIETNYGEQTGQFSTLDALSTLAFYHDRRTKFFTQELTNFILLGEEQGLPLLSIKGSYSGALGIPQFMPSTYRNYAVKYAPGSGIDLIHNNEDAIVSIGNYLARCGWRKSKFIASSCHLAKPVSTALLSKQNMKKPINVLKKLGISPDLEIPPNESASIMVLHNQTGEEYWLGFHNFNVIMRYNPHIIYAMAVYQLSREIQKSYDQQAPRTGAKTTSTRIAQRSARKLPTSP